MTRRRSLLTPATRPSKALLARMSDRLAEAREFGLKLARMIGAGAHGMAQAHSCAPNIRLAVRL